MLPIHQSQKLKNIKDNWEDLVIGRLFWRLLRALLELKNTVGRRRLVLPIYKYKKLTEFKERHRDLAIRALFFSSQEISACLVGAQERRRETLIYVVGSYTSKAYSIQRTL